MNHPVGIQPLEQFILRLALIPSAIACLHRARPPVRLLKRMLTIQSSRRVNDMAQESPTGFNEGMNPLLVAGLERTGCLAEAEYMNAELFGNGPRPRGSLGTSFRGCSAYPSRVSRMERLTHKSKGATMTGGLER